MKKLKNRIRESLKELMTEQVGSFTGNITNDWSTISNSQGKAYVVELRNSNCQPIVNPGGWYGPNNDTAFLHSSMANVLTGGGIGPTEFSRFQ